MIPDAHRLDPEFQEKLIRYVHNGGRLVLLGEKCARLFEPLLGVRLVGEPRQVTAELETPLGPFAASGVWQEVEITTAKPVGFRYPTRDFRRGQTVAATMADFGQGKVVAVFGPVALAFYRSHHPGLRHFIGQIMKEVFPDPMVRIEAPPTVDIALRRANDGRLTLHLLNRTGFPVPDRYSFIDAVSEVGPIRVSLRLPSKPRAITWQPEGRKLRWKWQNGSAVIFLPSLHIHGIIVVD